MCARPRHLFRSRQASGFACRSLRSPDPDGTLFGEGVKTRTKEKLLEECNLHTVVRLPKGVFNPYTGIKTNLLFFTKGDPTTDVWFYEHPYPDGAKSYSKTKPMRITEFEPEKRWWKKRRETDFAWKVTLELGLPCNATLKPVGRRRREGGIRD